MFSILHDHENLDLMKDHALKNQSRKSSLRNKRKEMAFTDGFSDLGIMRKEELMTTTTTATTKKQQKDLNKLFVWEGRWNMNFSFIRKSGKLST